MTRQRIRPSLKRSVFTRLPLLQRHAAWSRRAESMAIEVIRMLMLATPADRTSPRSPSRVNDEVASYLNNKKRRELARIEDENQIWVQIFGGRGCLARIPGPGMPRQPGSGAENSRGIALSTKLHRPAKLKGLPTGDRGIGAPKPAKRTRTNTISFPLHGGARDKRYLRQRGLINQTTTQASRAAGNESCTQSSSTVVVNTK